MRQVRYTSFFGRRVGSEMVQIHQRSLGGQMLFLNGSTKELGKGTEASPKRLLLESPGNKLTRKLITLAEVRQSCVPGHR